MYQFAAGVTLLLSVMVRSICTPSVPEREPTTEIQAPDGGAPVTEKYTDFSAVAKVESVAVTVDV